MLPVSKKAHEIDTFDRLDLPPQALDRVAMDTRQQMPLAPLLLHCASAETPAHHVTLTFQTDQRRRDGRGR